MTVRLRMTDRDDTDAVVAFGQAVVPPHYTPILGAEGARRQLAWWTAERVGTAATAGRLFVAVEDGEEVVGVVETGELAGEQVIWKLSVAPAHRGRGLGVDLLGHALDALPGGTDHVLVEHVAANARAARFYQREGFSVLRVDPAPSGDDRSDVVWRRKELGTGTPRR